MKIACPHCDQRLETDEETIGQTGYCPTCTKEFVVQPPPHRPPPPATAPAPPPRTAAETRADGIPDPAKEPAPLLHTAVRARRITAASFVVCYLVAVVAFLTWEEGFSEAWEALPAPLLMGWLTLLLSAGGIALLILARPFKGRRILLGAFTLLLLNRTIFTGLGSWQQISGGFGKRETLIAYEFLGMLCAVDGWALVIGFAAMMWMRGTRGQAAPPAELSCKACQTLNAPGEGRCHQCGGVLRPMGLAVLIVANLTLAIVFVVLAFVFALGWAAIPVIAYALMLIAALVACYRGRRWGLGYLQWVSGLTPLIWVARATHGRDPGGWSAVTWITFAAAILIAAAWVYYLNTPRVKAFCSVGREE